jgi:hypothetical protein
MNRLVRHRYHALTGEFIDHEAGDLLPGPLMVEPGAREQVL